MICTQVPGVWPGAEQEVELVPGRWKPKTPGLAIRRRRLARRRLGGGIYTARLLLEFIYYCDKYNHL